MKPVDWAYLPNKKLNVVARYEIAQLAKAYDNAIAETNKNPLPNFRFSQKLKSKFYPLTKREGKMSRSEYRLTKTQLYL